jgi:hypothetical protein
MPSLAQIRARARGFNARHLSLGLGTRRTYLRAEGKRASLNVNPAGSDNGITYSALYHGSAGNSIRVRHVVSGASTPLSVTVSGNDVTVNVATNGSSVATSTANQVVAAVNANTSAAKLLFAQATEGTGAGVVAAQAYTNLTGGA